MKNYDVLKDDILTLIKKIAIPASIGSFFITLYNVIDTIFAGQIGNSGEGLAGVSITFPIFLLLLSISIGLGAGTTALVGNAIGTGNSVLARKISYNSFFLTTIISIIILIIIFPLMPGILKFMNVSNSVLPYSLRYIRVIYLGILTFTIPGVANSILSAQGRTKPYRNILILGFFLNIILDPLFLGKNPLYFIVLFFTKFVHIISIGKIDLVIHITEKLPFLPDMGTMGIALSTVLIQLLQMIYMLYMLKKSNLFNQKTSQKEYQIEFSLLKALLKQGLPAMLNMMTITTGIFILNYFVSYAGGKDGIAALGIGYRIEQMAMLPANGIYVAMMAIISQNNGAGNYNRIYETFKKGILLSVGILVTGSIILSITKLFLISLFTNTTEIVALANQYMSVEIFTIPAYGLLSCSATVLQAIKLPKVPMYVTLFRQFVAPLVLYSLIVFVLKLHIVYIWISVLINVWSAGLFLYFYSRKQLKYIK